MAVITCSRCGRVQSQTYNINVCHSCLAMGDIEIKMEAVEQCIKNYDKEEIVGVLKGLGISLNTDTLKILAIREYTIKYPSAKVFEVQQNLCIPGEDLDRYIEEGSLQLIYEEDGVKVAKTPEKKENKRKQQTISQLAEIYNTNNKRGPREFYNGKSKLVEDLKKRKEMLNKDEKER